MDQGYSKAHISIFPRQYPDACAYSYTCTFMNSLLPHPNLVHVPTYTCPWFTHSCTYVHTYAGPESIHMHWHEYIHTLMHMCEYPFFQQKGLRTYGQIIYTYTILYLCIQIVHHTHISYISHIQTPYSVCTCTYMSKIWTALSMQTSSPMDIYTHIHIFMHTVCLRIAFLFIYLFLKQGLTMSLWSPGWPGTHCVDLASLKLRSIRIKNVHHHT